MCWLDQPWERGVHFVGGVLVTVPCGPGALWCADVEWRLWVRPVAPGRCHFPAPRWWRASCGVGFWRPAIRPCVAPWYAAPPPCAFVSQLACLSADPFCHCELWLLGLTTLVRLPAGELDVDSRAPKRRATPLSEDELDLLAVWFTVVKTVHALGVLALLPPLVQVIGTGHGLVAELDRRRTMHTPW